jgi:hypothetical protein
MPSARVRLLVASSSGQTPTIDALDSKGSDISQPAAPALLSAWFVSPDAEDGRKPRLLFLA